MESPTELHSTRDRLAEGYGDLLREVGALEDAVSVERLVCMAVLPLCQPNVPGELTQALVDALENLGPPAAPLLAGAELLGAPRLRDPAAAALERLRRQNGELRVPAGLGALRLRDAERMRSASADMYVLELTRPGDPRVQTAALVVEHEETGGALTSGLLGEPRTEEEARRIREKLGRSHVEVLERASVEPSTVRKVLLAATERTRELDIEVDLDLASCLPLLSLAVAGDPQAIGPVRAAEPDRGGLYVAPEDHEEFERLSGEILDDFEQEVIAGSPEGSALQLSGEFIAGSMLTWKWSYDDGRLARWTAAEVEEFLLDYTPRKISLHDDEVDHPVVCAIAFLDFLDDAGVLEGDTPETLARVAASLRDDVAEALRDPSRWGPAKSLMSQAESEGVDFADHAALQAWMDDFNSRPVEERDRVLGPSLGGVEATARPPARTPGARQQRRRRRKGARAARRRNRR
jgi:hypothetical protein